MSKRHGVKGERISNIKSPNRAVEIDTLSDKQI